MSEGSFWPVLAVRGCHRCVEAPAWKGHLSVARTLELASPAPCARLVLYQCAHGVEAPVAYCDAAHYADTSGCKQSAHGSVDGKGKP